MLSRSVFLVLALAVAPAPAPRAQERIALTFPVDCAPGEACVIQNHVDHDPGPGLRDHACGALTYDGHDGTDIRLPTLAAMRAGVAVLAAADGTVLRLRDGEPDVSIRDAQAVDLGGRDCGNGVLIDHGGGWTSQYCHLRKGSVSVRPGARVTAGQRIGEIGLSGRTEFPHLHFALRREGRIVDPQAPDLAPGACGAGGRPLWRNVAADALYPDAFVLLGGFADGPVSAAEVDDGDALEGRRPARGAQALVAYVRTIGLRAGDGQRLSILAPGGGILAEAVREPLESPKAAYLLYAGRRRTGGEPWPSGRYEAVHTVTRRGEVIRQRRFLIEF